MSIDKGSGPVDDNSVGEDGAAQPANVHVHPATAKATTELIAALQREIYGWMADEIEELAESFEEASGAESAGPSAADVRELSDQLARQADMLGYPKIVEIAERLKQYSSSGLLDEAQTPVRVEEQLAELRAAIAG